MSKKNKVLFEFDAPNPKIRRFWNIDPATKVHKSKKFRSRKRENQELPILIKEAINGRE